jgi:hypothetical protein
MTYKFEDLDLSKPLYAIVEFQYGAQIFKPGDEFNWRHMAIGQHMVSRLWNARQIRHTLDGNVDEPAAVVTEPAAVVTEPAAVVTEPAAVVTEPAAVVTEPAAVAPEAVTAPEAAGIPATLENLGMGWYNVVVEGLGPVNPSKLKGKSAALAWAAENNYLTGE